MIGHNEKSTIGRALQHKITILTNLMPTSSPVRRWVPAKNNKARPLSLPPEMLSAKASVNSQNPWRKQRNVFS